ncbi:GtrA family protein [uncultured Algimonas sp.]|uniref:GtrA family protein n=1 Tax=uncultured Algimonas sp. TaxID=1547920 RepID=UPI0026359D1E|nr:GtrA family protein [uncultured Algimonas sp.]
MTSRKSALKREAFTTIRFGAVGIVATFVHAACVVILSLNTAWPPVVMNSSAFLIAFAVAALGHSLYTFRIARNRAAAVTRYFVLSVLLLCVSNGALYLLVDPVGVDPAFAKAVAVAIVPGLSYLLSRFWAFAPGAA